jgi:restriction system protein
VIRWKNRVMWRRYVLVKQGLLKADSPRGIWELTKEGWEASGVDGSPY